MAANAAIYRQALRGYKAAFYKGLGESGEGLGELITRVDPDETELDRVIFADMDVDLPKYKDRRVYVEPVFHHMDLETDEYRKGFKVPDRDWRRDKWGLYASLAADMGRSVPIAQMRTAVSLLTDGFAGRHGLAYDGQFFLDTDHMTRDGQVQRNAWTLELTPENYDTVYANLETIRLPNGEFAHGGRTMKTCLIAGPSYRSKLKSMFDLPHDGNNPRYKQSEYRIWAHLSGQYEHYWFLMIMLDGNAKPLMMKETVPATFVEQTHAESDAMFEHGERRYGVNSEWGMAYGRWEVIQGSTGEDALAA